MSNKNSINISIIETERLVLIPMNKDIISDKYLKWMNDFEVCKYLETNIPYSKEELESFVNIMINKKAFFWAIFVKNSNNHIGNIKIDPINIKNKTGEYGILMGDRNYWGKGFAKEASLAVIKYCFEILKLRKISLGVIENNLAAVNLYKSIGFEIEGVYKMHGEYDGKYCNAIRMSLFNTNLPEVNSFFKK